MQQIVNWIWIALFVVIVGVRKYHERRSGKEKSFKGTPVLEVIFLGLWGISTIAPFFYIFSAWISFADLPFSFPELIRIFGLTVFAVSIWILHRSHADLGKMWSLTVEPGAEKELVTKGIYKKIRHPMYTAHVLWGISQCLLFPNLIAGPLSLAVMLVVLLKRIPREEKAMKKEFGEKYNSYMKKTGAIFPKS